MDVVEFRESDIDAVFDIQRAAYRPLYERYRDTETSPYMESKESVLKKYTRPGVKGYLFMVDGAAAGAVRVSFGPEGKSARISALCVYPKHQGKGIAGRALLEIERMHGDVKRWTLDTIEQEAGNCRLYERLGYVRTGKAEKLSDRMTLVHYEKV